MRLLLVAMVAQVLLPMICSAIERGDALPHGSGELRFFVVSGDERVEAKAELIVGSLSGWDSPELQQFLREDVGTQVMHLRSEADGSFDFVEVPSERALTLRVWIENRAFGEYQLSPLGDGERRFLGSVELSEPGAEVLLKLTGVSSDELFGTSVVARVYGGDPRAKSLGVPRLPIYQGRLELTGVLQIPALPLGGYWIEWSHPVFGNRVTRVELSEGEGPTKVECDLSQDSRVSVTIGSLEKHWEEAGVAVLPASAQDAGYTGMLREWSIATSMVIVPIGKAFDVILSGDRELGESLVVTAERARVEVIEIGGSNDIDVWLGQSDIVAGTVHGLPDAVLDGAYVMICPSKELTGEWRYQELSGLSAFEFARVQVAGGGVVKVASIWGLGTKSLGEERGNRRCDFSIEAPNDLVSVRFVDEAGREWSGASLAMRVLEEGEGSVGSKARLSSEGEWIYELSNAAAGAKLDADGVCMLRRSDLSRGIAFALRDTRSRTGRRYFELGQGSTSSVEIPVPRPSSLTIEFSKSRSGSRVLIRLNDDRVLTRRVDQFGFVSFQGLSPGKWTVAHEEDVEPHSVDLIPGVWRHADFTGK